MSIQPEQPTSIWKRPVSVKFSLLAKALGKGTIAGAFGNWPKVADSGIEIVSALGLKATHPSATAWIWVQRSLLQAMSDSQSKVTARSEHSKLPSNDKLPSNHKLSPNDKLPSNDKPPSNHKLSPNHKLYGNNKIPIEINKITSPLAK